MVQQRITVIRHGNAVKAADTSHEAECSRELSATGVEQVLARRVALGKPTFGKVFSSPLLRATMTAELLAQDSPEAIEAIGFDGPGTPLSDAQGRAFAALSYSSLATYRAHADGWAVLEHGVAAWKAVSAKVAEGSYAHVLVTGHFPLISAMAWAAADAVGEIAKTVDEIVFGEAEGYTLLLQNGKVTGIDLHQ